MTKVYELPNDGRLFADVDESTGVCTITEVQLDSLIRELNYYAEKETGHWTTEWNEEAREERQYCSNCGKWNYVTSDFCPNCGADMRGDKE